MQTLGSTNKSPVKLSMQRKINWHDNLFTNGENQHFKNLTGWFFKVTTLKNSLLSQQAVTSKEILVPYTNLELNPYPNTQLDLFCSDNLFFWCMTPNTWLTNCADPSTRFQSPARKGCWLQSSSIHPNDVDREDAWSQTLRCTNTATSSQERWTRANFVSDHNLFEQTLLNTCATCVHNDGP